MGNEWILLCFASCSVLAAGFVSAAALGEVRGYAWQTNSVYACISLALIAVGGTAALVSLGHPQLVLGALHNPGSGIFWELLAAVAVVLCCCGYLAANCFAWNDTTIRAFVVAAACFSFVLLAAIGKSFHMPWREALNTPALYLAFPGWGLAAAALSFLSIKEDAAQSKPITEVLVLLLGIFLVLLYPAALLLGSQGARSEIMHCLEGEFAFVFWGATIGCGMLVPVALAYIDRGRKCFALTGLFFLLIGSASFQWLVIKIGTADWQFFNR